MSEAHIQAVQKEVGILGYYGGDKAGGAHVFWK